MTYNVIVAGVGGQGSILASHILAEAAIQYSEQKDLGYRVRVGETFGAAQRGGAVASHVRIGEVFGPLIGKGKADLVIALEPLEGLRVGAEYLAKNGIAILSTKEQKPMDVKVGAAKYPSLDTIRDSLAQIGARVVAFDAEEIALRAGSPKCLNIVMVGAAFASGQLPFSEEALLDAIENNLPSKLWEMNRKAFALGKTAFLER
ncbi:MAG: indolepyruvate oxidoreductase subunit beta [Oscillospiraceae bacterium]|nr:indolepyruvate oxidoreductase subunit beta [Oscillospiraceae bacterium]